MVALSWLALVTCLASGFWLEPAQGATPPPDAGQMDAWDLWRKIRHQPPAPAPEHPENMISIAPVVSSKPSTGVAMGVGGSLAFYRGDPATTRISSAVGSITVSTRKQTSITMRFGVFARNDRWRVEGDNRALWTSQDTYGLGMTTTRDDQINARFDHFRVEESLLKEVRRNLYAGGGVTFNVHMNVRPGENAEAAWQTGPYLSYTRAHGFDEAGQTSAGLIGSVVFDTRDSPINASRGWLARTTLRTSFDGFLGADATWQAIEGDVRTYVRLSRTGRVKLAAWAFGNFVVGGVVPYFDLPATATDTYGRSGRAYAEGRFRGSQLFTADLELRATLTHNGLLGAVAFVNTHSVSNPDGSSDLFDGFAPGGGAGLRLLVNKHSKTNLCFDVGFGRSSHGIYIALQEVF